MRYLFIRHKIVSLSKPSFVVAFFLSLLACGQPANDPTVTRNTPQQSIESKAPTPQATSPSITPTPDLEVSFGDHLKIFPITVSLEDQSRRYEIDAIYPKIEGSTSAGILKLNKWIKKLATDEYKWTLSPSTKSALRYYEKFPGISNSVSMSYEVPLATHELLSIYFNAFHYGIGAAHSVQHSFAVNYDLRTGRILKLRDLFKSGAKHLEFISAYCISELAKDNPHLTPPSVTVTDVLAPRAKNYESWTLSKDGIRFNFDACNVDACAAGAKQVVIPFVEFKAMLDRKGPLRSFIEPSA
jgi:hypothetical protein